MPTHGVVFFRDLHYWFTSETVMGQKWSWFRRLSEMLEYGRVELSLMIYVLADSCDVGCFQIQVMGNSLFWLHDGCGKSHHYPCNHREPFSTKRQLNEGALLSHYIITFNESHVYFNSVDRNGLSPRLQSPEFSFRS